MPAGTPITVNFPASPDAFDQQSGLHGVYDYLTGSTLVNQDGIERPCALAADEALGCVGQDVAVDSWYEEFMEWATADAQEPGKSCFLL